jgi:hypothetical protein
VGRGARVEQPWQAAALRFLDDLQQLLGDEPSADELSNAFWHVLLRATPCRRIPARRSTPSEVRTAKSYRMNNQRKDFPEQR